MSRGIVFLMLTIQIHYISFTQTLQSLSIVLLLIPPLVT